MEQDTSKHVRLERRTWGIDFEADPAFQRKEIDQA
jgi:hypothetical protein